MHIIKLMVNVILKSSIYCEHLLFSYTINVYSKFKIPRRIYIVILLWSDYTIGFLITNFLIHTIIKSTIKPINTKVIHGLLCSEIDDRHNI